MEPSTDLQRAALYELHKRRIRNDLQYWATVAIRDENPNFAPAPCHRLILDTLNRALMEPGKKIMLFCPSGSGKTTYTSRIFPAWALASRPGINVLAASHNAAFAETKVSARVQSIMRQFGDELGCHPIEEAKTYWTCSNGSTYRAAGAGAGILGERADLVIIDDPFGSWEDAASETIRNKIYNWYRSDVNSRMKPGASVILMHQRLHMDDLAGRLLAEEGDEWEILYLPALWDQTDWNGDFLETDAMGRQHGESVWPDYLSADFLEEKRKNVGAMGWASMYQQRPTPAGGSLFTPALITRIAEAPQQPLKIVRYWDVAASAPKAGTDPDWTVGLKMQRNHNGTFTVLDVVRFRAGPEEVKKVIRATADADKLAHPDQTVHISIPQDPGAAGKFLVDELTRALAGHVVESSRETGDKYTRAMPFAAMVNAGQVTIVATKENGAMVRAYLDELELFPNGKKDDQIDASSGAFAKLMDVVRVRRPAVFGRSNHMAR